MVPGRRSTRLPKLLERSLPGRDRLLLASNARLLVVLPTPKLEHDPRLLYLLLEALEGSVERLVVFDLDPRQNDPSLPVADLSLTPGLTVSAESATNRRPPQKPSPLWKRGSISRQAAEPKPCFYNRLQPKSR